MLILSFHLPKISQTQHHIATTSIHPYYHTQAYIHARMRAKTNDFLKVLNRARPEVKGAEKKTIGWVGGAGCKRGQYLLSLI